MKWVDPGRGLNVSKMGAPSKYTTELADKICLEISTSELGLHAICKKLNIGVSTVFQWLADEDKKDFVEKYARAREAQADFMAEQILDICDDTKHDTIYIQKGEQSYEAENKEWVNRSKLRVDARKWLMSKLMPKKYGDKLELANDPKNPLPAAAPVIIFKTEGKDE